MIKKVLAGLALGLVVLFATPEPASASPAVPAVSAVSAVAQIGPVAQQTTVAPGPSIDPSQNVRAIARKTLSKVVVGLIVVVLAGIVLWGRSIRRKRRKSAADQAKGK